TIEDEFGYLDYDQRHVVKVNLRTQLPLWNLRLASSFRWQSGRPFASTEEHTSFDNVTHYGPNTGIAYPEQRTIYPSHRRNDQRNEAYWLFDTGVRKDFTMGKAAFEASLDVFNLFNNDALYISAVKNDRVIGERHTGRQFQVGARVVF